MHYKIVAVNEDYPDDPIVLFGEITPKEGEHPLLGALNHQYGDGAESAELGLKNWSGGESLYWAEDFATIRFGKIDEIRSGMVIVAVLPGLTR